MPEHTVMRIVCRNARFGWVTCYLLSAVWPAKLAVILACLAWFALLVWHASHACLPVFPAYLFLHVLCCCFYVFLFQLYQNFIKTDVVKKSKYIEIYENYVIVKCR